MEGLSFIKDVNDFTRSTLKDSLKEGLANEESIDELKKRVSGIFDIADKSRSEKIARTETLRSTNFATEEAYRQSDIVEAKEWLTATDELVCEECAPMDGDVADLGQGFKSVDYPPLHPNCRCTLLPVLKER